MNAPLEDLAILRLPEVMRLVSLSKSTIYQMIKEERFPRSVSLGGKRAVGWLVGDIRSWLYSVALVGGQHD
jgi:prophage regulatory protein